MLTSLSDANDIVTVPNGWNAVLLYRSRRFVLAKLDILGHSRVETCILKPHDGDYANWALLLQLNLCDTMNLS